MIYQQDYRAWFEDRLDGLRRRLKDLESQEARIRAKKAALQADLEAGERFYRSQILREPGEETKRDLRGVSIREAVVAVLWEHRRPMHLNDILAALERAGVQIRAKRPRASLAASMGSDPRFQRTAPGTFWLAAEELARLSRLHEQEPLFPEDAGDKAGVEQDPE